LKPPCQQNGTVIKLKQSIADKAGSFASVRRVRGLRPQSREFLRASRGARSTDPGARVIAQAFAVFLPVKSTGVMGDGRTYEFVVALRAVQTSDFMTADRAPLPNDLLGGVSSRIINEVWGIKRVTYDISTKPSAKIECE